MLEFRHSTIQDLDAMERIANEGKAYLKQQDIDQWQRGTYPDRPLFASDEQAGIGYVVADGNQVLAVCAMTFTGEEDYRHLTEGQWLTPDDVCYATIHRSAVAACARGRHLSGFLFDEAAKLASGRGAVSIRVDTHPDNRVMQGALTRAGFVRCGSFFIGEGDEKGGIRWGYERLLTTILDAQ